MPWIFTTILGSTVIESPHGFFYAFILDESRRQAAGGHTAERRAGNLP